MSESSSDVCPRCGGSLAGGGVDGLCPRCLGALNLAPETALTGEATGPHGTKIVPPQKCLTPAELAPHFPQLEIIECLGRGGMGVVYKARQKSLNRFVALKLLAPERASDPSFAERFAKEAQALAALNHPHIVGVYDFGQAGGFYFLLMEFVDGVNLRQAMKAGRFTPEQALAVVPPVCEALQYAHEHGIVHRDIKPENLLLDKDGRVKIADFGIAKMLGAENSPTDSGLPQMGKEIRGFPESAGDASAVVGTPQYMAPEQKEHRRTDHRADIYSLGVVLYELLTGELPADKLQPPSRKVQIDVRLDEIVLRALETKPELRYQTAGEFRTHLETVTSNPESIRGEETRTSPTAPPFLKLTTATLLTPAELATFHGQFFAHQTRGQLILDAQRLTHTRAGQTTVIPLTAIRDVSLGQYPRSMNPAGIALVSVTFENAGQLRQVLLSPMEGYFALPRTWNARAAEWATAIREAVTAATGRAPTTTPSEQLGVPGSHVALLTMFLMPLVPLGVFLACLAALTAPGAPRHNTGLLSLFVFGMAALGFMLVFLRRRQVKSPPGSARVLSPRRIALGLTAFSAVLFGLSALVFLIPSQSPSGVASFICIPVGVSNNVVIVDVNAEVASGGAEVQAALDGPRLSPAIEAGLAETFFPPFAGTFVKPTPYAGNRPWRIWQAGPQTWRLGFALPDAALAQEAFENLRPIGPLPAEPRRTFAGTLFEVRQPGGAEYRASLNVTPPVGSNDPNWVSAGAMTTYNESGVNMNWRVEASQPGIVFLHREGGQSTASLRRDPKTKLYQTEVSLELTKVGTNRVLFVSRIGGVTARAELAGSFRDLSAELLRYKNMSTKTVRGAEIELCQFQGKPVTVQVPVLISTVTTPATVKVVNWSFPFYGLIGLCVIGGVVVVLLLRKGWTAGKVLLLFGVPLLVAGLVLAVLFYFWSARSGGLPWTGGIRIIVVGVVGLSIVLGFVALLVLLARKGGTAGKVVALVVAVPLLLLVLAVVALLGYTKVARDFGPGVGLERLSQTGQMVLEANYPVPPQQHPPGEVQQTQNGFRLQLPATQLASFEFFIRQADDSWQPVPSLTALVATGKDGGYHDSLYWTLRRSGARETTNQLWFWTVSANANAGRALPQLTDHGTNFTHSVMPGDTLDWWQLSTPVQTVLKPGEQQIIPLFRTHGTATARGNLPKEAFLRVRCEPLPAGLNVASNLQFVEAGLAAHALLAKVLPASNAATAIPPHIEFKVLRVENPPGTRNILLHFERDTNAALGLEVWQDVTPSPGLHKQPRPGTYLDSQMRTWVGVNYGRVLRWTLPNEFTEAEVRAVVKDIEQRAKVWRALDEGHVMGFATVTHRDGWKYHLLANVKRAPGLSTSLPAGAPAPNFATPQAAPDPSERATEPLALFTPVIDSSLGDGSYRLVSTLVRPRHVVVAEVALVDDRYSTAHTISQLGFYLGSADGTTNASARVTWSIDNVTEGEGAWIVRTGGEGGGSKFERIARLGSRNKGFADILVTPAQPENPDRGAETSLDDATTTWVAVRPERSHWVGPGEWNVGEWNSLTLFEARDDKGKVQRRLRLRLLVRPMLADAKIPWTVTLLRNGYWSQDQTLRDLIGGPPTNPPKLETPSVVPAPKPAPREESPKAGTPAEPARPTADAKEPLPKQSYAQVGVPTATLAATLTNWSAELNGLRLGLRLPETPEWRIGGQVGVELWVSNMGAKVVKFGHSGRTDAGLSVIARDNGGKDYRAKITQYDGVLYYFPWLLPPSHSVKVMEFNVRFDPPGKPGEHGRDAVFQLPPGDYKLHFVWTTPRLPNAPTTDWEGKLTSSDVEVKLLSAATSAKPESGLPERP